MNLAEYRARRRLGRRLIALAILLLLGQVQSSKHRVAHPLAASSCQMCALAHHPLALAPQPDPAPTTASEFAEPQTGPFRSEPFAAIALSAERAPPQASA